MGENKSDDPEFSYIGKKMVGPDGQLYHEIDEFEGEIGGYLYLTTTGSVKLYSMSTGMYLHMRTLTVAASGASALTAKVINGSVASTTTTKQVVVIASGPTALKTYHLDGLKGPVYTTSMYAQSTRAGTHIHWTGVLDPNMPSV